MAKKTEWSFDEVSSSHLWFLRLNGLIPLAGKTLDHLATKLLFCYFHVMNMVYNGMWTGYGVRMLADKRFEVDYLCELVVVESVCFRYLILATSRQKLGKIVNTCAELWTFVREDESRVVRSFERKAFFFRTFMLVNGLAVVVTFSITAYFFIRIPGATVNDTERRVLPFRFFVEVYDEQMFTLASLLQYVVCGTIPFEIAGIETVGLYLIMMACGYLRILRNRLLKFQNETRSVNHEKKFDEFEEVLHCAQVHQKIMLFCEGIESVTRAVFFFAVFTTVYNMSITGLKIVENDENMPKYLMIFVLNLFQFFTVQWGPEYLLIESSAIGEAAYFASIKQRNSRISKIFLLMMMRAQRPCQLTAGGYIKLSIETFGHMVSSAFSFFAVLRSFKS